MPNVLHIDFETFSRAPLGGKEGVGGYRYANDPSTEILCCAVALNDGEPELWTQHREFCLENGRALALIASASEDPNTIIYAHNASFEMAISDALWTRTFKCPPPRIEQWRCTAVMARRAALPWALGKLADKLKLSQQKDNKGDALIRTFSVPQKKPAKKWRALGVEPGGRIMPHMAPDLFKQFCDYCKQDVRTEQAVHKALAKFEMTGMVLDVFHLDARINARGLPVNIGALQHANEIVNAEMARLNAEFSALTGLNSTQNEKYLEWLKERGYKADNLQAQTIDEQLEDMEVLDTSDPVKHSLWLRKQFAFAAVKKIPKMLACAGPHDNKVRGTIIVFGAGPGRWSGALIQPQNFKRPTIKHTEQAYRDICAGCDVDWLRMMYGNPLEVISSCIRHFIHDCEPDETEYGIHGHTEQPFIDADYNAVEARIVCWLAGQDDVLELYRNGADLYCELAEKIYGVPAAEIRRRYKAEDPEATMWRFIAKQARLGCGFQMSAGKFIGTCAKYGTTVDMETAELAVRVFREANPKIVQFWWDCERAAKNAIRNPGTRYKAGRVEFFSLRIAGMLYLFMKLPSGRTIAYPEADLELDPAWQAYDQEMAELKGMDETTRVFLYGSPTGEPEKPKRRRNDRITFYAQLPESQQWGRVETYGGKLAENCLTGDTLVKSEHRGWVPLETVTLEDRIFDGIEYVAHEGLVRKGVQPVIKLHGVACTADHLFLSHGGWVKAEDACTMPISKLYSVNEISLLPKTRAASEPVGQKVWTIEGNSQGRNHEREDSLGLPMQVRQNIGEARGRHHQRGTKGVWSSVPTLAGSDWTKAIYSRDDQSPGLCSSSQHAGTLHQSKSQIMAQLRRAWNWCVQEVESVISSILEGYGADVSQGPGLGQEEQRQGLHAKELSLDYSQKEQPQHALYVETSGRTQELLGCGGEAGNQTLNAILPAERRADMETDSQNTCVPWKHVFDIKNCGPRHCFAVKSAEGPILIAHNCTQGTAADVMMCGALNMERAGYEIATLVHDQALDYCKPGQTAEEAAMLMMTLPRWADGLPLEVEAKITPFYKK